MQIIKHTLLSLLIVSTAFADEPKLTPKSTADHLQDVSVTIRSESGWTAGEGSGVIFSRLDKDGNWTVNYRNHDGEILGTYKFVNDNLIKLDQNGNKIKISFTADDSLQYGECIIESEDHIFDGRFKSQIETIISEIN